jgi:hypothetical protein
LTERMCHPTDDAASWSPWVPLQEAARTATRRPGVYMARAEAVGSIIVYVGMAGERRGLGVRGRLGVYATGRAIHSGLGKASLDRALTSSSFVRERLRNLERGEAATAQDWGRAANEWNGIQVRWTASQSVEEARELERVVMARCEPRELWNVRL